MTKSCPRSILKSGLSQSPYAFVKMYGQIWKAWNVVLILISNSQGLDRKSQCKSANFFDAFENCIRLAVGILLRCAQFGTRFYLHSRQNVHKEPRDIRKHSSDKIGEGPSFQSFQWPSKFHFYFYNIQYEGFVT